MNKTGHTPGPWRGAEYEFMGGDYPFGVYEGLDADGVEVAACHTLADARLIAAAPELLEACEAAMRIHTLWAPRACASAAEYNEAIALDVMAKMLRAAIAKATGTDQ